ncbi:MAG: hypothetical protein DRI57_00170 [Deltaproteobacteria bacterium]|nr:MAG: hypothetical protein DRI57_00170 [Deltaproteobacteria bacterium]
MFNLVQMILMKHLLVNVFVYLVVVKLANVVISKLIRHMKSLMMLMWIISDRLLLKMNLHII